MEPIQSTNDSRGCDAQSPGRAQAWGPDRRRRRGRAVACGVRRRRPARRGRPGRAPGPRAPARRPLRPITFLLGRRRPEHRTGPAEGLRRLQGPAPGIDGTSGRSRALAPNGIGSRAPLAVGRTGRAHQIDGLFVRAWTRDGLLADLGADPEVAEVLARVPEHFQLAGPGETTTRAFPLAVTRGVQTTGLYYNKALLDRAGLEPPATIADLKAMVKPLAALGAAPLVHCAGDAPFNPLLVMWLLPMIAGRAGDPLASSRGRSRATSATTAPSGSKRSRRSPTCRPRASCCRAPVPRITRPCSCSSWRARRP